MSGGNIKVVVRCRPLNSRELARGAKGLIRMEGSQTVLHPPDQPVGSSKATEKKPMTFSFDRSYWSAGPRDEPQNASQQTLYEDLGVELLDHSFEGFNTCIFAYGQTGSGKSYSMMGYGADKGIIPLTTSELFNRVESRSAASSGLTYTVEVSYIEIYNEKVRDLLNPQNKGNLRVREHPSLGPYVEDLSRLVVENYGQMMTLMDEGNKARTVASTNMNETSSRSHAVFTVILTQKRHDAQTNMTGEKVSKISLVDLAGSERQASTGATGTRLKEGANINKSLTTLGKVIAALASTSAGSGRKKKDDFVPYRDSVLTWLLKESLGGNSKTAMIAAISPADYEETLSTLRYADAAKKIKTHAVVNEDPNAKLIRELKEELEMLRLRVQAGDGEGGEETYDPTVPPEKQIVTFRTKDGEIRRVTKLELQDQLEASEKLMDSLKQTWEEKMEKTRSIHVEREKALEEMGISIDKDMVGVHAPQRHPSLVNLNEDPLMSECLVYQLKPGRTVTGSHDGAAAQIKLSGLHILETHCIFNNDSGIVTLEAMPDARTFVNGKRVPPDTPVKLLNGFRVILGDFHVFRYNDPAAVRKERQKMVASASMDGLSGDVTPGTRSESPFGGTGEMMDWSAARREVADIAKLGDQDLDRLFDDIVKVRTQRGMHEGRAGVLTDMDARFMTPSQTEETLDTFGNPWAGPQDTTMTSHSIGTPQMNELDPEVRIVKPEVDEPISVLSAAVEEMSDAALQQQHLTKQLRNLAREVKRIRSQAAKARMMDDVGMEPANWSSRELKLIIWAVGKWKRLRGFAMAEEVLCGAVQIKEANIIARDLEKSASYNFLIGEGANVSPVSSLDGLNGVVEFEDVSGSGSDSAGPRVLVKVIDRAALSVYAWDMPRFQSQLIKMRQVRAHRGKPGYSTHFRIDEPFVDVPASSFSCVGAARFSLRLLANQLTSTVIVPIICPYTCEAIGSCRIALDTGGRDSTRSGSATPNSDIRTLVNPIIVGSRITIGLIVDAVKGISSTDFASIHAQTRLTSLFGPTVSAEDTFACLPIDLGRSSSAHLSLRKTITIVVTSDMLEYMQTSLGCIDFFAKVRPAYLDRLERWDRNRELSPPSSVPGTPLRPGETRPSMRRNETNFIAPEHHDILASIEVLEMALDGEYASADVIDDVFELHQGLQRRLGIKLTHSSGRALPWSKLGSVSTSDVRAVSKGVTDSVSKPEVEMKVTSTVEYASDGTSTLLASGTWDTASHNAVQLNRKTASDQLILIRLVILVEVDNLDEPVILSLDLPIRILGRDARRSSFRFWSSQKVYPSLMSIFSLDLLPPLAQNAQDLWRLDTAEQHVAGEEALSGWKPRSLSLIEDAEKTRRISRLCADTQVTKVVLDSHGDVDPNPGPERDRRALVERCISLWKREMDQRIQVDLKRESAEEAEIARKLRKLMPDLEPKLVPKVQQAARVETLIKAGQLMILRDSSANQWEKMIFALRRPYLHLHPSSSSRETQIINLTKAKITASPDVEQLLQRRFAFTIFTPTNSFILQAPNQKELSEWLSVMSATAGS